MGDDGAVEDQTVPSPTGAGPEGRGPADWAVPGSAAAQPVPEPVAPLDAPRPGAGPAGAEPAAPGPTVAPRPGEAVPRVAMRPMTAADILDGGFAVVKARPRRIMAITAGFVVPTHLVAAYLQRDVLGGLGISELLSSDPTVVNEQSNADPMGQMVGSLLISLIPAFALVCIAAAIAHLVAQWMMGRDAPAGEMVGVIGRRLWPLVTSFVVVKVAEGAGLLGCYIGIVFIMALFVPVAPIVGVEGGGGWQAVARSVRLTRTRYFPTMGVALLMGVVGYLLTNALSALPQSLAVWIGLDDGWPLLALGSIVSQIVVLPFVAAATVLLYFDLRVRTEGLDLEMAAIELFDRDA